MADATANLGINLSARDLASGPIGLLARNFGQLRGAVAGGMPRILAGFSALAAGAVTLGAGMAGFRAAWGFAETASEFGREMADVQTVSRATSEEFLLLRERAIEAGIQTQFAPTAAAAGLRMLAQQGIVARDAMDALVPTLDFAAAGGIEVAEAAEIGAGVMNAYGQTVDELPRIYDTLTRATQMSALSSNEFMTVMGRAASSGAMFGQNLTSMLTVLASVRSQGIPATVAVTAVGEAFRRMGAEEETQRLIQEQGVDVVDRATGRFRNFGVVIQEYGQAISHLSEAEQARLVNQTFHVRGMRTFHAMTRMSAQVTENGTTTTIRGAEALAHYTEILESAAGATQEARTRRLNTFWGVMELLSGSVETLGTVFGGTFGIIFMPLVSAVTDSLNVIIRAWVRLSDRTQQVIGILTLVGSGFAVVTGFLMMMGGGITLVVTLLGSLLGTLAAVMGGIVLAMLPVIAMFAAAGAAAYTLYHAYQTNLGGLGDFVDTQITRIRLAWKGLTEIFTQGRFSDAMESELNISGNESIVSFLATIEDLWIRVRAIATGFREAWSGVWQSLGPVITELRGAFTNLMSEVSSAFGGLTDGANGIPFSQFESFGAMLASTVGGALAGLVRGLTTVIRFVLGVWRVFRVLRNFLTPFFNLWLANMRPILWLLQGVWEIVQAIAGVMRALFLPGRIFSAIVGVGTEGEEEEAPRVRSLLEAYEGDSREREGDERTEASTRRPAAAEAEGRGGDMAAILEALEGREGRGRDTRIDNQVTMMVGERELGEVVQSIMVDQATGEGRVVTDEFGQQSSVF